jgi:hypothetical protein
LLTTTCGCTPGTASFSSARPRTRRCRPTGSAATHDVDGVGGLEHGEGGTVAPGSGRVVGQFLVLLEREAAVDDRRGGQRSAELEDDLERGRAQLGPAIGAGDAREHPQGGADGAGEVGQRRQVQRADVGQPARGGQPRRLVEQAQHLRHDAAVDIGVDQHRGTTERRQLAGQRDGDGGAAGSAGGTPDRHQAAGANPGVGQVDRLRRWRRIGQRRAGVGERRPLAGARGASTADGQHDGCGQVLR